MALLSSMSDKERKEFIDSLAINWNNLPTYTAFPYSYDNNLKYNPVKVEKDEQGNTYGYKVLVWDMQEERFQSPIYPAIWEREGFLVSDKEPTENSKHGIYFMKSVDDPELNKYLINIEQKIRLTTNVGYVFIVRCLLSGVVVETERGFRSQYAKIEGVAHNGNWKTYQDFQNEAQHYNRTRYQPYKASRYTDDYRTHTTGTWNTLPPMASQDEDTTKSGS